MCVNVLLVKYAQSNLEQFISREYSRGTISMKDIEFIMPFTSRSQIIMLWFFFFFF